MRSTDEPREHRAFTLIELMVVVAIIAVLIAILVPSLGRARQQAYQVKCMAKLHGIGLGIFYYVQDPANGNGFLPNLGLSGLWASQVAPYLKPQRGGGLFRCPSDPSPPYVILNGPSAGSILPRFVGNAPPQPRLLGPLIEPISYAPSRDNTTSYIRTGKTSAVCNWRVG